MRRFDGHDIVGDVVARCPRVSRVFEEAGIDFCCSGQKTLEEACRTKRLDPRIFMAMLEEAVASVEEAPVVDAAAMSMTELADHIEQTHHKYLRSELPRLEEMTRQVMSVHGEKDARLGQVWTTLVSLAEELSSHMMKEELVLFPLVRRLEASGDAPILHYATLFDPIRQMELEHDHAAAALERLRALTDGFTPPAWACHTYRGLLDGLAHLERDMHQHVHKENNILFPRALGRKRGRDSARGMRTRTNAAKL